MKVVFLDRDGVINIERGDYTYKVSDFQLTDGLIEALNILREKNFKFILITNQGGISKEIYNHSDVFIVHNHMQRLLNEAGIELLDVYYCPHHAIIEKCICRKPDSLMIEKAVAKYGISSADSYFIGDSRRDIIAAERANIKGIKINSNDSLMNYLHCII